MRNQEQEKNENINDDVIGWCTYCKESICSIDDYVKKAGQFYHVDCWKLKNNFVEELEFDE